MDVEAELKRGTEDALSLLAEKRSEAAFYELLEYAAEACLEKPPVFLKEGEPSHYDVTGSEQEVIQTLGARSLSVLLEMKDGMHAPFAADEAQLPDDPALLDEAEQLAKLQAIDVEALTALETILTDDEKRGLEALQKKPKPFVVPDVLSLSERFSLQANNRILENAERFGQALIDESFAILGEDAPRWVEKLKNATTRDEELDVVDWLNGRIITISNNSRSESSEEDEKAHFYPPIRLSPKFIGQYPKLDLQPSCLSASIIATSFFERAGKITMHAGVTTPANEAGTHLLVNQLTKVAEDFTQNPHDATEEQARKLIPTLKASQEWKTRPLAQHGAIYTKLNLGWIQFDAYNSATVELLSDENEHLDGIHAKLTEWKPLIPNLEISTSATPNKGMQLVSSEFAALSFVLESVKYTPEQHEALVAHIDEALKTIPDEAYVTYLKEACLDPLLAPEYLEADDNEMRTAMNEIILTEGAKMRKQKYGTYDSRLNHMFDSALREFIRWDATPEEFITRCRTEPAYRARRAEDFMHIPAMMAVLNAQVIAQESRGFAHLSVDIGNSAIRIGLATLSDFARYDDHPLPPQFWVTHWPGIVSVVENLDNPFVSNNDSIFLFNNLLWGELHPFTSNHNYDKISTFLSEHGEEKNDGNEQEGS